MKNILISIIALTMLTSGTAFAQERGVGTPQDRLLEIKNAQELVLSDAEKTQIITTCSNAQQIIKSNQTLSSNAVKKRLVLYGTIQKELKAMELRMSKQGADASELDLLIGTIQQNIDELASVNRASQQIVDDIVSINCQDNPELYAAGLGELREYRITLLKTSTTLKDAIINAPQTTFLPLIDRLSV